MGLQYERSLACLLETRAASAGTPDPAGAALPYTPSSLIPSLASLLSTTLLSYDQCYVCAMEHKVALLVLLLCALRCETLSLTPFRETDRPLYVTTSTDQRSAKPQKETGRHELSCKHYYVLSALRPSQKFCLVGTEV